MIKNDLTPEQYTARKNFRKTLRRLGVEVEQTFEEIMDEAVHRFVDSFGVPDSMFMSEKSLERMAKEFNGLSDTLEQDNDSQSN